MSYFSRIYLRVKVERDHTDIDITSRDYLRLLEVIGGQAIRRKQKNHAAKYPIRTEGVLEA